MGAFVNSWGKIILTVPFYHEFVEIKNRYPSLYFPLVWPINWFLEFLSVNYLFVWVMQTCLEWWRLFSSYVELRVTDVIRVIDVLLLDRLVVNILYNLLIIKGILTYISLRYKFVSYETYARHVRDEYSPRSGRAYVPNVTNLNCKGRETNISLSKG